MWIYVPNAEIIIVEHARPNPCTSTGSPKMSSTHLITFKLLASGISGNATSKWKDRLMKRDKYTSKFASIYQLASISTSSSLMASGCTILQHPKPKTHLGPSIMLSRYSSNHEDFSKENLLRVYTITRHEDHVKYSSGRTEDCGFMG